MKTELIDDFGIELEGQNEKEKETIRQLYKSGVLFGGNENRLILLLDGRMEEKNPKPKEQLDTINIAHGNKNEIALTFSTMGLVVEIPLSSSDVERIEELIELARKNFWNKENVQKTVDETNAGGQGKR